MALPWAVPAEHIERTREAIEQVENVLAKADWVLREYVRCAARFPYVTQIVGMLMGSAASTNIHSIVQLQDFVSKLKNMRFGSIDGFYAERHILKFCTIDLEGLGRIAVRFAADLPAHLVAEARTGGDTIIMGRSTYQKPSGRYLVSGSLLNEINIVRDGWLGDLCRTLPRTLLYELIHILGAADVSLQNNNLPPFVLANFHQFPRDSTGRYIVYGLELCQILANSPQHRDAMRNADNIACLIIFLALFFEQPEIDSSSGYARY